MQRTVRSLLLLAALPVGGLLAQEARPVADSIAVTKAPVSIRTQPRADAVVTGTLPAQARVLLGTCAGGWCRVTRGETSGYVLEEYLAHATVAAAAEGRGYINAQGQRIASPTRTPDNQPPQGATAQCRDGTYSFSANRRGTCSHHGGVARWL